VQSLEPNGLQVRSCETRDRSGAGPVAVAITVGTDSEDNVSVGMTYFDEVVNEDEDFVDN
jgi:hypothetical protein